MMYSDSLSILLKSRPGKYLGADHLVQFEGEGWSEGGGGFERFSPCNNFVLRRQRSKIFFLVDVQGKIFVFQFWKLIL